MPSVARRLDHALGKPGLKEDFAETAASVARHGLLVMLASVAPPESYPEFLDVARLASVGVSHEALGAPGPTIRRAVARRIFDEAGVAPTAEALEIIAGLDADVDVMIGVAHRCVFLHREWNEPLSVALVRDVVDSSQRRRHGLS